VVTTISNYDVIFLICFLITYLAIKICNDYVLQLRLVITTFVKGIVSCFSLLAYCSVQRMLCFCFVSLRLVCPVFPVSMVCQLLVALCALCFQFLWFVCCWLPCVPCVFGFYGLSVVGCLVCPVFPDSMVGPLLVALCALCFRFLWFVRLWLPCVPCVSGFYGLSVVGCLVCPVFPVAMVCPLLVAYSVFLNVCLSITIFYNDDEYILGVTNGMCNYYILQVRFTMTTC